MSDRHASAVDLIAAYNERERQLLTTIETQQAQIKGLVAAFQSFFDKASEQFHVEDCQIRFNNGDGDFGKISLHCFMEAKKALSTLPAEFLERERKREAVIRAAKFWVESILPENNGSLHFVGSGCKLREAVEALD